MIKTVYIIIVVILIGSISVSALTFSIADLIDFIFTSPKIIVEMKKSVDLRKEEPTLENLDKRIQCIENIMDTIWQKFYD